MRGNRIIICILILICLVSIAVSVSAQEPFNINCIRQFDYNWQGSVCDVRQVGDFAYLACEYEGFRIIDVSQPESYQEVSHLDRGIIKTIEIYGQFAYLGNSDDSLFVVDISSKTDPQVIATIAIPGVTFATRIFGQRLLVCGDGLTIFDISNPSEPEQVCAITGYNVYDVVVRENLAYLSCARDQLRIFDISNIANPLPAGVIGEEYINDGVLSAGLYGNYAIVAGGFDGFRIYDLTTSQLVSSIDSLYYALWVKVQGDYAYLAYGYPDCPLAIINISNPAAPQLTSIYSPPEDIATFDVVDDKVFVADYRHGLRTIDISDKTNPIETVPFNRYGFEMKVAFSGSTLYALSTFKLTAIDVSVPSAPVEYGYFESNTEFADFSISGNVAFVLAGEQTVLYSVDFSNPVEPVLLDQLVPENYYNHYRFTIYNDYLYLIGYDGIIIYDISNPSEITAAGFYEIDSNCYTNFAFSHYLVLENRDQEIVILDLANPLEPVELSSFPGGGYCLEMQVNGNVLYVVMGDRLKIIDITNLTAPALITEIELGSGNQYVVNQCDVLGDYLYLALEGYGLAVYDISNPASVSQVGYYDTPGCAYGVAVNNNIAVVADHTGLGIYDCSDVQGTGNESNSGLPAQLALYPSYPNPFNSSTVIRFEIAAACNVAVDIIDLLGRKIATIANENFQPGLHSIHWNGIDLSGRTVSSGQYFVRVQSGSISRSTPVTLLK